MNVDDVVAARIEAARARIQAAKRRREELSAARARGLAARHATKLRNLRSRESNAGVSQTDTTTAVTTVVDPEKETP
ncbi:hypothetical protein ACIG8S_23660 [[Kitasatospora] papulosa]|uniref:hypothetical protein n=1 Tax=Streptomyces TaxID=1883 RepID=UPI002E761908|nr:hypothetical protein [Streptomyces sp. JV181]MEE1779434.1 hypothetical protein [Streptomyces sp. JV181]